MLVRKEFGFRKTKQNKTKSLIPGLKTSTHVTIFCYMLPGQDNPFILLINVHPVYKLCAEDSC